MRRVSLRTLELIVNVSPKASGADLSPEDGRVWGWAKVTDARMKHNAYKPEIFRKVYRLYPNVNEMPLYFRVICLPRNVKVSPGLIS